ncbi:MAG: preprotein translocase subunit SecE [Nitrosomonas sp.]|uniref:preprotein translocase subunit SecE n=1 Tax=Nitrosomonas sp. TaxID=42353 RepID=UPI002728FFFD|nr:preprotein translocase subunit SecE [Nitrosomonas sp.]MDO8895919.1 preprotein translocase subunit SecE [Nitrosomonas sp.]MDP1550033.1 preprotein translocase subunit SecE [Nitrosomonas sp.]MDP1935173.1 preprotein translocase subunit SecE [Nitrosomonas sp.]MDP3281050.1 preprotein translocase subunit SecE [Nitrosomonas sp.]MDP3662362.1 preprotein translocase subunit SecE [Nitrosomonas sp.]
MNKLKLVLVFVFIVAGVAGFIYLSESPMVVRVLSIMAGFLLAVIAASFTVQGQEFYVFCKESTEETKKVVWPNRKETLQTSGVVFAFVVAMALFLWFIDSALMSLVKLMMNQDA